jgi:filamentous hemagglutinin
MPKQKPTLRGGYRSAHKRSPIAQGIAQLGRMSRVVGLIGAVGLPALFCGPAWGQPAATALPSTPTTTYGAPITTAVGTNSKGGPALTITQTAATNIVTWNSFNIGSSASVKVIQPSSSAVLLNKVSGSQPLNPTEIDGMLNANGRVYIYDPNGIIFAQGATVNVGTLIASSLKFDENRVIGGLVLPGQTPVLGGAGTPGNVTVEHNPNYDPNCTGSACPTETTLTVANGGLILLAAPNVTNSGALSAPDGQVILAAGSNVYLAAPSTGQTSLRGLLVEVSNNSGTSTAENDGQISVGQGNATMIGYAVNQNGLVSATTSVNLNGSIYLYARDQAVLPSANGSWEASRTGNLVLGPNSVTEIQPVDNGSTITAATPFTPSDVELNGATIQLQQNASILAPGGNVNINAQLNPPGSTSFNTSLLDPTLGGGGASRVDLAPGSVIDVSGSTGAVLPMASNVISVNLRGTELADNSVLNNSSLPIYGSYINVDARQGVGAGFANISGWLNLIGYNIGQINAGGGNVNIAADGAIVQHAGSTINVSGGYVTYQPGYINTSYLTQADGTLVNVAQAQANTLYTGVVNLPNSTANYQAGYVQGSSAGAVNLSAPIVVLQGALSGQATAGPLQRDVTAVNSLSGSISKIVFGYPQGGELQIGGIAQSAEGPTNSFDPSGMISYAGNVLIGGTATLTAIPPTANSAFDLSNADQRLLVANLTLDPAALALAGFDRIVAQTAAGSIDVSAPVTLAAGGQLTLTAGVGWQPGTPLGSVSGGDIQFDAPVTIPGGQVSAQVSLSGSIGSLQVADGVSFNLAGLWTNDQPQASPTLDANGYPIGAYVLKGGSLKLVANQISIGNNVSADVSAGAWLDSQAKTHAGTAGSITLEADTAILNNAVTGGILQYGSGLDLSGYGFSSGGGTLKLVGSNVYIGTPPAPPLSGSNPYPAPGSTDLWLQPGFFQQGGFTNYNIAANYNLTVYPNTSISPQAMSWQLDQGFNALSSGALSSAASPYLFALSGSASARPATSVTYSAKGIMSQDLTHPVAGSGTLTVGSGAQLLLDPGANLTLSALEQLTVLGVLDAPAGNIVLSLTADNVLFDPTRSIWFGPKAKVLATGSLQRLYTNADGISSGSVLGGGTIQIGDLVGGSLLAADGYVVAVAGSKFDVSGITASNLNFKSGGTITPVPDASSPGGSINIRAYEGLLFAGTLAGAGGDGADGGSLTVALDTSGVSATGDPGNPLGERVLNIMPSLTAAGSIIPKGLTPGGAILYDQTKASGKKQVDLGWFLTGTSNGAGAKYADEGWISTTSFAGGGFGQLTFSSPNVLAFDLGKSNLTLHAADSLVLDAPNLAAINNATNNAILALTGGGNLSAGHTLTLSSPYIELGSTDTGLQLPDAVISGNSTLDAVGATIDLIGNSALNRFSVVNLNAAGDIRLVGLDTGSGEFQGSLEMLGKLTLTDAQTYPTTMSNYTFMVGNNLVTKETASGGVTTAGSPVITFAAGGAPPVVGQYVTGAGIPPGAYILSVSPTQATLNTDATASGKKLTFTFSAATSELNFASNGNTPQQVLSAAGSLTAIAATITQAGLVEAPFGQITLGNLDNTWSPSVLYGAQWNGPSSDSDSRLQTIITATLTYGPGSVTSVAGAGVVPFGNVSNGSVPTASTWQYGEYSIMQNPTNGNLSLPAKSIASNAETVTADSGSVLDLSGGGSLLAYEFTPGSGGSQDVLNSATTWAISPNYRSGVAPVDSSSGGTGLTPGASVYLSGIPGLLPAGIYTLLPGHYALLPGFYSVSVSPNTNYMQPGSNTVLPDNSMLVAGQMTLSGSGLSSSVPEGFIVSSGSVISHKSQFTLFDASTYFTAQAAANGLAAPELPLDGGYLAFNTSGTSSSALALSGTIELGAATGAGGAVIAPSVNDSTWAGTISGAAPTGGRAGTLDVAAPQIDIVPGQGAPSGSGAITLSADYLNALGAGSLVLGGLRNTVGNLTLGIVNTGATTAGSPVITFTAGGAALLPGEYVTGPGIPAGAYIQSVQSATQVTLNTDATVSNTGLTFSVTTNGRELLSVIANSVEFFSNAQLSGPDITVVANNSITLDAGSALQSSGAVSRSPENLLLAGGALLRVSSGSPVTVARTDASTNGTLNIDGGPGGVGGAVVQASGSANLDATGGVTLGGSLIMTPGSSLSLGAPGVSMGSAIPSNLSGLQLGTAELAYLGTLGSLTVNSYAQPINLYGAVSLGSLAAPMQSLSLQGGGIQGDGGTASFYANTVNLVGTATSAIPTAASSGALSIQANTLQIGGNVFPIHGYADTSLTAQGQLTATSTTAQLVTDLNLALNAGIFDATSGAAASYVTGGGMTLSQVGTPPAVTPGVGGQLNFTAAGISSTADIVVPSGKVTLSAIGGGVDINGGQISVAGSGVVFNSSTSAYAPGGTIVLGGNEVTVNRGAVLDVSAINAAAGLLSIAANAVTIDSTPGTLKGAATGTSNGALPTQGRFSLSTYRAGSGDWFGALNAQLNAAGFTESRQFGFSSGDLSLGGSDTIIAHQLLISTDNGSINIGGNAVINASGASGGSIQLYASQTNAGGKSGNVTLGGNAQLLACATTGSTCDASSIFSGTTAAGTSGNGGQVIIGTGSANDGVNGVYSTTLGGGSNIYLSAGTINVAGSNANGTVLLRAPKVVTVNGPDVAIASLLTPILNSASTTIEGYQVYLASTIMGKNPASNNLTDINLATNLDPSIQGAMYTNAASFMSNQAAILSRLGVGSMPNLSLNPGVEVRSSGNLTVSVNEFASNPANRGWNLDTWRFGPDNSPVMLTLRAAGDLSILGSISDGFVYALGLAMPDWSLGLGPSASLRLVGGADLVSADPLSVVPGGGNVILGYAGRTPALSSTAWQSTDGTITSANAPSVAADAPVTANDAPVALVRTGTGSINIASGGDVTLAMAPFFVYKSTDPTINGTPVIYDSVNSSGEYQVTLYGASVYTAGQASTLAAGFSAPQNQLNTDFGAGSGAMTGAAFGANGGAITIAAQGNVVGPQNLGSTWYYLNADGQPADNTTTPVTPAVPGTQVILPSVVPQMVDNWLFRQGRTYVDANGNVQFEQVGQPLLNAQGRQVTSMSDPAVATAIAQGYSVGWVTDSVNGRRGVYEFSPIQTAWWTRYDYFNSGVATFGGGNLSIVAGGNVSNLSASVATSAYAPGATPAAPLVEQGGGNLLVRAGGDILGGEFYVQNGIGTLRADGSIAAGNYLPQGSSSATAMDPVLALGNAVMNVTAGGNVAIETAYNPMLTEQSVYNVANTAGGGFGSILGVSGGIRWNLSDMTSGSVDYRYNYQQFSNFSTYGANSAVNLIAIGGNLLLVNDTATLAAAGGGGSTVAVIGGGNVIPNALSSNSGFASLYALMPGSFSAIALGGDLASQNGFIMTPAPLGQFDLLAAGSINLTDGANGAIRMLDNNPAAMSTESAPRLFTPSDFDVLSGSASQGTPPVALHTLGELHATDTQPVEIVALTGDIVGDGNNAYTLSLPKFADIQAGGDIVDLGFAIQQNNASDVTTITAGRDFVDTTQSGGSTLASNVTHTVTGPGNIDISAGRTVDFGNGNGLVTRGNLDNPYLPNGGAGVNIVAGAVPNYAAAVNLLAQGSVSYVSTSPTTLTASDQSDLVAYLQSLKLTLPATLTFQGATTSNVILDFLNLPAAQQAPFLSTHPSAANILALETSVISGEQNILVAYMQSLQPNSSATLTPAAALTAFNSLPTAQQSPFLAAHPDILNVLQYTASADQVWTAFNSLPSDTQAVYLSAHPDVAAKLAANAAELNAALVAGNIPSLDASFFSSLVEASSQSTYTNFDKLIAALFPAAATATTAGNIDVFASQIKTEQGGGINLFTPTGSVYAGLTTGVSGKTPSTQGIFTIAGGPIAALVKQDFLVNLGRVFTLGGGDITLVSQYNNIDAGKGAKTAVSAPPPQITLDSNGTIKVDVSGSISGSGIATLKTNPNVAAGDVFLIAPRGTVNAGDAGVRSSGNIIVNAAVVLNGNNFAAAGSTAGVAAPPPAPPPPPPPPPPAASSSTDSATKNLDNTNAAADATLNVEVVGYGSNLPGIDKSELSPPAEDSDAVPGDGSDGKKSNRKKI